MFLQVYSNIMTTANEKSHRMQQKETFEEQVSSLPICIISEILLRLSIESVLHCRLVCKSWCALTRESSFTKKHFQWHNDRERDQFILQDPYGDNPLNLSLLDIHEKVLTKISPYQKYNLSSYSIVCSCNGLLCLRPKERLDRVIISNPITKECLFLPSTTTLRSLMSYQLGFHFDSTSGNYKAIREFRSFTNQPSKFQLITIGKTSWIDLDPSRYEVEQGFDAAIFWNNGFHWKISERECKVSKSCILRYDLQEEKFTTISYPKGYEGICYYPHSYQVVRLGDDLKIVEYDLSCYLRIWKVVTSGGSSSRQNIPSGALPEEGEFLMLLQYSYALRIPVIRMWQQEMICEIEKEVYLIQVTMGINECKLDIYTPANGIAPHQELDIAAFPKSLFKIICFKPSLLSPHA
ncbi:hypothetical protein M5689_011729 [Euphorbia peplus]|nr:hypothetical protein M5689_011729 [Euphorbia peplus]